MSKSKSKSQREESQISGHEGDRPETKAPKPKASKPKPVKPEAPEAKGPTTEGACSLFIEAFLKAHLKDEKVTPGAVAEKAGITCSTSVRSTVSYVTRRVVASLRKSKLLQS